MKMLSSQGKIHPFFAILILILLVIPMAFYGMYLYIAPSLPNMSSLQKAPLEKPLQIYTKDEADALTAAFKEWQFFGRIDVLYKNAKQTLISIDEQAENDKQILTIDASSDYQFLPATHALVVIAKLEADKSELPWFETAILERLA